MKLGIMQPYFMPYILYFKLIKLVDRFVILDDVNFIKKGWINRNIILVNNKSYLFTLPIDEVSQNKKINEISYINNEKWKKKFLKTIEQSYNKSPEFKNFFPVLEEIIYFNNLNISKYNFNSLFRLSAYLNIKTEIIKSSCIYANDDLTGQERILDICIKNNCSVYLNLPGGVNLYNKELFASNNIDLKFLNQTNLSYKQFKTDCNGNYSIIDYLMFNDPRNFK